jgi:hypothetical protein
MAAGACLTRLVPAASLVACSLVYPTDDLAGSPLVPEGGSDAGPESSADAAAEARASGACGADALGGKLVTLFERRVRPLSIAADDKDIYWLEAATPSPLVVCVASGPNGLCPSAPRVHAIDCQGGEGDCGVSRIALTQQHVFWSQYGASVADPGNGAHLFYADRDLANPQPLQIPDSDPATAPVRGVWDILARPSALYFAATVAGGAWSERIYSCTAEGLSCSGGRQSYDRFTSLFERDTPTGSILSYVFANGTPPQYVACSDDPAPDFADNCAATLFQVGVPPVALALLGADNPLGYVTQQGDVAMRVYAIGGDAGPPGVAVTDGANAVAGPGGGLAYDGAYVYFGQAVGSGRGNIFRVPRGDPKPAAQRVVQGVSSPVSLAMAGGTLFWVDSELGGICSWTAPP